MRQDAASVVVIDFRGGIKADLEVDLDFGAVGFVGVEGGGLHGRECFASGVSWQCFLAKSAQEISQTHRLYVFGEGEGFAFGDEVGGFGGF